jgi:pimeloyl-ACP methyl ester carboxylesterase
LLLNIGANHHIGSNRMYVRWARDWAALGFRVLRFDLSGVGDSPARPGRGEKEVYSPEAMPETREAMDFMESRGCVRMLLVGLCSGSYVAFHSAVQDHRVAGIVLVNQPVFHWTQGDSLELHSRGAFKSTNFYARRAFDPETYLRALRGKVQVRAVLTELGGRLLARGKNRAEELAVRLGVMQEPDEIARSFRRLSARGCETLVIIGSNDGALDVLERRVGVGAAKMRGAKGFRLEVFEGTDHTFTPREAQERLKTLLTDHLLSRFG